MAQSSSHPMSPQRRRLLEEVAGRVPVSVGGECVRVAVDGVDGGFWLDTYYASLRADLLDPLGAGGTRRYRPAAHYLRSDELLDLPLREAAAGSVLIVDGLFMHRDELIGLWDLSVFLDVPFEVSVARMAGRDGRNPDPDHPSVARYVQGQRLYFEACAPWARADLVVDNTTLDEPVLMT